MNKNRKYDAVLFDLDGTLADSGDGVTNSVAHALKKLGLPEATREQLNRFIGPPLRVSFHDFYGLSEQKVDEAIAFYREYYTTKGLLEAHLYDGIPALLETLSRAGLEVAVATSKPEPFAVHLLEHFDVAKWFSVIAGASMDEVTRGTKEQVIAYALEQLQTKDPGRILMIGDRMFDINGAKSAGLGSLGVLYGYGTEAELREAGADAIAARVEDIADCVLNA